MTTTADAVARTRLLKHYRTLRIDVHRYTLRWRDELTGDQGTLANCGDWDHFAEVVAAVLRERRRSQYCRMVEPLQGREVA